MIYKRLLMGAVAVVAAVGFALPSTAVAAGDTVPPPTPSGFFLEYRYGSNLRFDWIRTVDNSRYVPRYELSYAGKTVDINHYYPGHTQNASELDLSPGNAYVFELRAVDQAGNKSVTPAQFVLETTPPGEATNLRQVSDYNGYPDIVAFDAAPDNSGQIADYEVFLNGESLGTTGSGLSEFSLFEQVYLIACIDPPSGPATVEVRATDSSYNQGAQLSEPLTVYFP